MSELTPRTILAAIDEGLRESAHLAALGYDPSQGRPGRALVNDALERRGYGRPIGNAGPDRPKSYGSLPDDWIQSIGNAVTGRPGTPIGEIIAALNHGPGPEV